MIQKNTDVLSEKVFNLEILDVYHMVKHETLTLVNLDLLALISLQY